MTISQELPRYRSHKQVWALKIKSIVPNPNPDPTGHSAASSYGAMIYPEDGGYPPFQVTAEYMSKHRPQPGGYYVQYEDEYLSYSPAKAFEEGYTLIAPGSDKAPMNSAPANSPEPLFVGGLPVNSPAAQRQELERVLVGAAGQTLACNPGAGKRLADGIKLLLDELHSPAAPVPAPAPVQPARDVLTLPVVEWASQAAPSQSLGPNKVTQADVQGEICSEFYFTAAQGVLGESEMGTSPAAWTGLDRVTICTLVLRNGAKVVGVNYGAIDPRNHSADIGRKEAYKAAEEKVWELRGFRLRDKQTGQT